MLNLVSEVLQLNRSKLVASTGSTDLVSAGAVIIDELKANYIDDLTLCICLVPIMAVSFILLACILITKKILINNYAKRSRLDNSDLLL